MNSYDTVTEALADLQRQGYTEDFNLKPFCVECRSQGIYIYPEDFTIDHFYRFEGASNPDDNTIVYAISSKQGLRGTLVDAYGAYSESLTQEMVEKLRIVRE